MAYVTPAEVLEIMEGCSLTSEQMDPYILTAHLFITRTLTGSGLSESTLKDIEKWFVAHIIASVKIKNISREKVGAAEIDYANKYGTGLHATSYGEMVLMLDTTGKIASAGRKIASIYTIKQFDE